MSEIAVKPRVTMIPATLNRFTAVPIHTAKKRRVAAYARVSTDDEEQQTSYENQISYYTEYIRNHDGWEYAGIFTDEGISGTNTRHRDGFNAMIQAALAGKIDLIITKSVSRFARNTVDTLTTVRKLKEHGIEVYFEKENIFTLDSKGELLITIMGSLAQEESRSISENVTWGMRKRFADGKVSMPYKHFLGYRRGEDGLPEIVPEEAETVRLIYQLFMEGKAPSYIARQLTARQIPSPAGKEKWRPETVKSILTNEKYKGDALLQKTFRTDFLTKRSKINEGEVRQYYVDHSHPAIIDPALFDAVQMEMKRRARPGHRNYTPHCFSGKIYCAECGGLYGSKAWHGDIAWRCNALHNGKTRCKTPVLHNSTVQDAFVMAFNRIIDQKDEVIRICEDTIAERCNTSGMEAEMAKLKTELQYVSGLMEQSIHTNARVAMGQDEYNQHFEEYERRFKEIQDGIAALDQERATMVAKMNGIRGYIATLRSEDRIAEFNEALWHNTVDRVWIKADGTMRFEFKGGPTVVG